MTNAQRAQRLAIISRLAVAFERSGVRYTCTAVVVATVADEARRLCAGTIHKPDVIALRTADLVYERWQDAMDAYSEMVHYGI